MSNENLNIVPTTGNAEEDHAALIAGKLVWLGERPDGDTAIYLSHDDEDGYFVHEAVRWGAVGSENVADQPQFQYGGKEWVTDQVLDRQKNEGGGLLRRGRGFVEFWKASKRFLNVE